MRKKKQTNKQKKTGIHPSFTCIKCGFDHKAFLECCKGFQSIQGPGLSPLGWKIKIFKKLKKYPQGFPQTLSVPSFRQIWPFMPSLEHPKACSTYRHTDKDTETETDIDTHTHTHTHTHTQSQVLAQLKFRIVIYCSSYNLYLTNNISSSSSYDKKPFPITFNKLCFMIPSRC